MKSQRKRERMYEGVALSNKIVEDRHTKSNSNSIYNNDNEMNGKQKSAMNENCRRKACQFNCIDNNRAA